jgi:hypothetical protein
MAVAGQGVGVTERVLQTTIAEWSKKVSEETTRNLVLFAMLQKKGKISYGHSGGQMRWVVRKGEHPLTAFVDMEPVTVQRRNTKVNAYLGWRGQRADDLISLQEKLENAGPEAMIKAFEGREALIREGAIKALSEMVYTDGESAAAVAANQFHGLESFMGITDGSQTATSIIATVHADTYASLGTVVGGVGGSATDTKTNRIWTPVIINTSQTPAAGIKNWSDYAVEYIREMLIRGTYGQGEGDRMNLVMLNRDAYTDLLNLMDDKERILVNRGAGEELVSLGFRNIVEIDGCPVTWDFACPTTDSDSNTVRGYGLNTNKVEFCVLGPKGQKKLFDSRVDFNVSYSADQISLWLLGNFKFESPRHFGKLVDIT